MFLNYPIEMSNKMTVNRARGSHKNDYEEYNYLEYIVSLDSTDVSEISYHIGVYCRLMNQTKN